MPEIPRGPQHAVELIDALVNLAEQFVAPDCAQSAAPAVDRNLHNM